MLLTPNWKNMKRLLYLLTIALIITTFSYKGYTESVVTNGLVSYWTFDRQDIRGDTAKDVWGKNNGTIVGAPQTCCRSSERCSGI